MNTILNPYLSFKDNARAAMQFYQSVFGGELRLTTFKEYNASRDPSDDDKIMHAELKAANGIIFMASDTPSNMEYRAGANISMSLSGEDEAELTKYYQKLSAGGTVTMPLEKAMWGDKFGMVSDKFGINWMVSIAAPKS